VLTRGLEMIDEYDRSPRPCRPRPRPASSLRFLLLAFVLSAAAAWGLYGTNFFGLPGWKSPVGWIKKVIGA
jgi:hypothetical protein